MSLRRLRLAFGVLLIVLLLMAGVWHVLGTHAYERELHAWQAAGGLVSLWDAESPGIPDDENAAVLWYDASDRLPPSTGRWSGPDFPEPHRATIEEPASATPDARAEVVAAYADVIGLAREAAARPRVAWRFPTQPVPAVDLPQAVLPAHIRPIARLLIVDAWDALDGGDAERVRDDLFAILALADHTRELPTALQGLVSISMQALVLDFVEEAYRFQELEDALLIERLRAISPRDDLHAMMRGELGAKLDMIGEVHGAIHRFPFSGWHRFDLAAMICAHRENMGRLTRPYSEAHGYYKELEAKRGGSGRRIVTEIMMVGSGPIHRTASQLQTRIKLFGAMVEARAFRAAHGRWPDASEIELPIDEMTGNPVHYERVGEGAVMWFATADRGTRDFAVWRWDTDEFPDAVPAVLPRSELGDW